MSDSKPVHCSIVSVINFWKNLDEPADEQFIRLYQSYVGTHIWTYICPYLNLGFVVFTLSQFLSNPTSK